jgi:hypothetical protein
LTELRADAFLANSQRGLEALGLATLASQCVWICLPNELRPRKVLQRDQDYRRDPGQQSIEHEEAKPMAGNATVDRLYLAR